MQNNYQKFFQLFESKDRLIDKLDLTDEQKDRLKAYFKKYPTSESKIDWNKKDLQWQDFEPLLTNEGKSKSQAKKKGISGLKEGEDYEIVWQGEVTGENGYKVPVTVYYPLSFLGSETLANPKVEPLGITGKWCISGGSYGPDNDDQYFRSYVKSNYDFFFVFTPGEKYAIARKTNKEGIHTSLDYFDSDDSEFEPETDYVIEGADGKYHLVEKFWDSISEKIKDYPKKLTWNSLVLTKEDGTQWSKDGKTLYNAGHLKMRNEWVLLRECQRILSGAFSQVDPYVKIIIPAGMDELDFAVDDDTDDYGVFSGFKGTVELEEGTTRVPDSCFYAACQIQDIILPKTIEEIGQASFSWMENDYLWRNVFQSQSSLNFKNLNLKKVGFRAFAHSTIQNFPFENYPNCEYAKESFLGTVLRSINLPEGIQKLPAKMFQWLAYNGVQIFLPRSLKSIEVDALGCLDQNQAIIRYYGTKEEWSKIETDSWYEARVIWEPVTDNQILVPFYCSGTTEKLVIDQEGSIYALSSDPQTRQLCWKLDTPHSMAVYSTFKHAPSNSRLIIPLSKGPKYINYDI